MGGNLGGPERYKNGLIFYSTYSMYFCVLLSYDCFYDCVIKNKRHFKKCDSVLIISLLYIVFVLEKVTSHSYTSMTLTEFHVSVKSVNL